MNQNIIIKDKNDNIKREIELEFVKPDFFNDKVLTPQPYTVRRFNAGGNRFYIKQDEKGEYGEPVPSVTTIKNMCYKGYDLTKWKLDNFSSYNDYQNFMNFTSDQGTLIHILVATLARDGKIDYTDVSLIIDSFILENNLSLNNWFNRRDLTTKCYKALLGFAQWVIEKNVTFLAIEWCLVSEKGYGGALDFYTELDYNGSRKRAIVDFKSGKPTDEHALQQWAYKEMLEEHNYPVDMIFTLHDKDFNGSKPTYRFINYTKSVEMLEAWERALADFKSRNIKPKEVTVFQGEINLSDFAPDNNILFIDPIEFVTTQDIPTEYNESMQLDLLTNEAENVN